MVRETKGNGEKWCAKITIHYCSKFYGEVFQCRTREEIQEQMKSALIEMAKKEQPCHLPE